MRTLWIPVAVVSVVFVGAGARAACTDPGAVATVRGQVETQCGCATAASHTAYQKCATLVAKTAAQEGRLAPSCVAGVKKCASQSTCGSPGAVTCLTTTGTKTRCKIKKSAALCTRSAGACVGAGTSCCDAADGCLTAVTTTTSTRPAPTSTSTTTVVTTTTGMTATSTTQPLVCTDPMLGLPPLAQAPVTITPGTTNCGGPGLSPPPTPPFSGEVDDATGAKLSDLGTGCLYFGNGQNHFIPGGRLPDGAKLAMSVVGIRGLGIIAGPGPGSGPHDCTLPAGSGHHCLNGSAGTDGHGACATDADCGADAALGACGSDARCFFGPPLPIPAPTFPLASSCIVNAFQQGACADFDLLAGTATFSAGVSARAYATGNADAPCPRCVGGHCDSGKNAGAACTPVGSAGTSIDCLPDDAQFSGALSLVLQGGSTEPLELAAADGFLCPGQSKTGAFGRPGARRVATHGTRLSPLSLLTQAPLVTLAAPFCIPPTGSAVLDTFGGLPGPGAFSVPARVDLSDVIRLGLLPLLP